MQYTHTLLMTVSHVLYYLSPEQSLEHYYSVIVFSVLYGSACGRYRQYHVSFHYLALYTTHASSHAIILLILRNFLLVCLGWTG